MRRALSSTDSDSTATDDLPVVAQLREDVVAPVEEAAEELDLGRSTRLGRDVARATEDLETRSRLAVRAHGEDEG